MLRIDKRLHLVVPVFDDDDEVKVDEKAKVKKKAPVAYVHSTPLPQETVERHFLLLGQTFAAIYNQGLGRAAGMGMARMLLKQIAENTKVWENEDRTPGEAQLLLEEIRRLTTVIVPGEAGQPWQQVPLNVAVERKNLSEEDRAEVENAIVFFIVNSAVLPRRDRREMLTAAADLWGAQVSSSNSTELAASLKTSKETVNSGAKSPAPAPAARGSANATVDGRPASVPR